MYDSQDDGVQLECMRPHPWEPRSARPRLAPSEMQVASRAKASVGGRELRRLPELREVELRGLDETPGLLER